VTHQKLCASISPELSQRNPTEVETHTFAASVLTLIKIGTRVVWSVQIPRLACPPCTLSSIAWEQQSEPRHGYDPVICWAFEQGQ